MNSSFRFVLAATLIAATGLFLHARSRTEIIPAREPLNTLPQRLGTWAGIDVPIPQDELAVLGPGDFLLRIYRNADQPQPYVDLFIAYFPSQRTGDTIHSPKNCLPGSGWAPIRSDRISIALAGHPAFLANRYIIAKGSDRELVLYWYWAHNRATASEYWAKFYLVLDAMRLNRSDGSLVRVTTPLAPGEPIENAQGRLLSLTNNMLPLLNRYVPR